nr:MAG TPA: hypothetical protein [Caudoviricetes sp.]
MSFIHSFSTHSQKITLFAYKTQLFVCIDTPMYVIDLTDYTYLRTV